MIDKLFLTALLVLIASIALWAGTMFREGRTSEIAGYWAAASFFCTLFILLVSVWIS